MAHCEELETKMAVLTKLLTNLEIHLQNAEPDIQKEYRVQLLNASKKAKERAKFKKRA